MEVGLGKMAIRPADFWNMSLREWLAAVDGFAEFHGNTERSDKDLLADTYATMEKHGESRKVKPDG